MFVIKVDVFKKILELLSKSIDPKPRYEVLSGIKVDITSTNLTFTAVHLDEGSIVVKVPIYSPLVSVKDDRQQTIILPCALLSKLIAKIKDTSLYITISYDDSKQIMVLQQELSLEAALSTYSAENFPADFSQGKKELFKCDASNIWSNANKIIYCASNDITQRCLQGINLVINSENLSGYFTATNGHRLGLIEGVFDFALDDSINVVIPKNFFLLLEKYAKNKIVTVESSNALFSGKFEWVITKELSAEVLITTRLFEDKFPNVKFLLDEAKKENKYACQFNKQSFLNALETLSILINGETKNIKASFIVNPSVIDLSVTSDIGTIGVECTCSWINSYHEDKFDVQLNFNYLKQAIAEITTEEVVMSFNKNKNPLIFMNNPYHLDPACHLVMPASKN